MSHNNPEILSFVQVSDVHLDSHYSVNGNKYCHEDDVKEGEAKTASAGRYSDPFGRAGSECDSPLLLLERTFAQLHQIDPDFVLWTGDSSRHDRDPAWPRSTLDVTQGIQKVAQMINSAFRFATVFPVIGNWDTRLPQNTGMLDYETLYQVWSILWSESQRNEIQLTFLQGGFYSVKITDSLIIVSLNTIDWFIDNSIGLDCKSNNQQMSWLTSILEEARQLKMQVIIAGHVPPLSYSSNPLYHPRCLHYYTNLIGEYSDVIIDQYFGHVNRDITYITTKDSDSGIYEIIPLNQDTLVDPRMSKLEIVGTLHTGSSIVPYFYPSFRWALVGRDSHNSTMKIQEHVQYFAPIDMYLAPADELSLSLPGDSQPLDSKIDFYRESCSTKAMGLSALAPSEWKTFLETIQHEIKITGTSSLLYYYWDCSVVHWSFADPKFPDIKLKQLPSTSSRDEPEPIFSILASFYCFMILALMLGIYRLRPRPQPYIKI